MSDFRKLLIFFREEPRFLLIYPILAGAGVVGMMLGGIIRVSLLGQPPLMTPGDWVVLPATMLGGLVYVTVKLAKIAGDVEVSS